MNGGTGLKFFAVSGHVEKPDVYACLWAPLFAN